MISIYGLRNPIDNKIFYIGASNAPKRRFKEHCYLICKDWKGDIISSIINKNLTPILVIIKENIEHKDAAMFENKYIRLYNTGQVLSNYSERPKNMDKNRMKYPIIPIRLEHLIIPLQKKAKRLDISVSRLLLEWVREHPCVEEYLKNEHGQIAISIVNGKEKREEIEQFKKQNK